MITSACLSLSFCLLVFQSVFLFVCLFVCLYICMFVCSFHLPVSHNLFICWSFSLSFCLSVCLSVCLFVYLSVCLFVYLSTSSPVLVNCSWFIEKGQTDGFFITLPSRISISKPEKLIGIKILHIPSRISNITSWTNTDAAIAGWTSNREVVGDKWWKVARWSWGGGVARRSRFEEGLVMSQGGVDVDVVAAVAVATVFDVPCWRSFLLKINLVFEVVQRYDLGKRNISEFRVIRIYYVNVQGNNEWVYRGLYTTQNVMACIWNRSKYR